MTVSGFIGASNRTITNMWKGEMLKVDRSQPGCSRVPFDGGFGALVGSEMLRRFLEKELTEAEVA